MTWFSRLPHSLETTGFGAFLLGMTVPVVLLAIAAVTR